MKNFSTLSILGAIALVLVAQSQPALGNSEPKERKPVLKYNQNRQESTEQVKKSTEQVKKNTEKKVSEQNAKVPSDSNYKPLYTPSQHTINKRAAHSISTEQVKKNTEKKVSEKNAKVPSDSNYKPLYTPPKHSINDRAAHSVASSHEPRDGVYTRIGIGWAIADKMSAPYADRRPNSTNLYTFGLGYSFRDHSESLKNFKAELTYSTFRSFKYERSVTNGADTDDYKQNIKVTPIMANLYYSMGDYSIYNCVPFVTAALGTSRIKSSNYQVYKNGTLIGYKRGAAHQSFAWALGAGMSHKLTQAMYLDVSYTFNWLGNVKTAANYYSVSIVNADAPGANNGIYNEYTPATTNPLYSAVTPEIRKQLRTHAISAGLRMHF